MRLRAVWAHSVEMGPDMHCCRCSWPIRNVHAFLLHSRSLAMRPKLGNQQYHCIRGQIRGPSTPNRMQRTATAAQAGRPVAGPSRTVETGGYSEPQATGAEHRAVI